MSAVHKSNVGLDIIRGLAALLVVLGHTRNFVGVSLSADLTGAVWQKALLLPTSFAQESVALFFVLSGYLVGGQVLREVGLGRFGWRGYIAKRLSRLWTVLIPGILFTFLLDNLTMRVFQTVWSNLAGGPRDGVAAVCNVAFLQRTHCEPYGSNDSLWSLSYEFWFYMLFAGAVVGAWGLLRREWTSAAIGVVVCIGTVLVFGPGLFTLIPSWLLGVVLALVHERWKVAGVPDWVPASNPRTVFVLFVIAAVGMSLSNLAAPPEWARFIVVGLGCSPLILLSAVNPWGQTNRTTQRAATLGAVSFSIYVFHLPIVKFLAGAFALTGGMGPLLNLVAVYVISLAAVALCVPIWFITERKTAVVRTKMLTVLRVHRQERGTLETAGPH